MKLDVAVAMAAFSGLKEDDTRLLQQIVHGLQGQNRTSRARILGALQRIYVA